MTEISLRNTLAQASEGEAVELLQQVLRQSVRMALFEAMEQEVNHCAGASINHLRASVSEAGARLAVSTSKEKKKPSDVHGYATPKVR